MKEDLRIYAKGLAFTGGSFSLRSLDVLISNYRKILDQFIAVSLGKSKADRHIREQIDYQVEIKEGSIELLVDFVMNNKELLHLLPTTVVINYPIQLFHCTKTLLR